MEGTYGKRVIGKLKQMRVLIIGLRGLGVEVAKNLILAGPRVVTLHDDEKVVIADLGSNFYLLPGDVGTPRAACVLGELSDANPNTRVSVHTGELTDETLASFDVIVATDDATQAEQVRRNAAVRAKNGKYIYASQNGIFVTVFSDFGTSHKIFDADGVPVNTIVLEKITAIEGQPTVCTIDTHAAERHGFDTGGTIKLEEVVVGDQKVAAEGDYSQAGIPADGKSSSFNTNFIIKEHRLSYKNSEGKERKKNIHTKFDIADCSGAGEWKHGGMAIGVKVEVEKKYGSLADQLSNPTICNTVIDFNKWGCAAYLHYARLGLWAFQAKNNGKLPKLHDKKDAKAVADEAKAALAAHVEAKAGTGITELSEQQLANIEKIALYARTELTSLSALWGGVVAQEVVKFTGKYTPIKQWIHYDCLDLLQDDVPVDGAPTGSRYDHQISIFGKAAQTKIGKARIFLVGCGALGCEFLKGFALSGYGCNGGAIHVTDMDTIELSNLSRQFLFRRKHVNKAKSSSASSVVVGMNPEIASCLDTKLIKVGPSTEDVFTAQFWDSLDFVVNALDNLHAREYVDSKCVLHGLPLFESGTLGTQANTVIALPHVTKSYREGAVAGEGKGIAQCTLKSFPSLPLHCIEYAKEKFEDSFTGGAQKLADFIEDREGFLLRNSKEGLGEYASLLELKSWLDIYSAVSLETCVQLGLDSLVARYRNGIKDLQAAFPEDARQIDGDTGADLGPFWRGHKRFPQAIVVDVKDDAQADYVWHATCIFTDIFGLPRPTRDELIAVAGGLEVPEWKNSGAKIQVDIEEEQESTVTQGDFELCEQLKAELRAIDIKTFQAKAKVNPTDFEKDDDTNHHIDWITSASCLRAWNYMIKVPSRQECRMVAGAIIPAIATTTAAITGFIQVEMLKYVTGKILKTFQAVTIDIGTNSIVFENLPDPSLNRSTAPDAEERVICIPEKFTVWDHITITESKLSVEGFVKLVSASYGVIVKQLWSPGSDQMLYQRKNPYKSQYRTNLSRFKRAKNFHVKAKAKAGIDAFKKWEAENKDNTVDLCAKYEVTYGPIVGANFIVLSGVYTDAEFNTIKMPNIKYVFA